MSSLNSGLWRAAQNTKIPGPSLVLSYRVNYTAAGAISVLLPSTLTNPAQLTPAQAPNNYAPQASPVLRDNEPQQGLRLFVTDMVVRDANGLVAGAASAGRVALFDANYAADGSTYTDSNATGYAPAAAGAGNTIIAVNIAAAGSAQPGAANSIYHKNSVGNVTTPGQGSRGIIVVRPYDQLGVTVDAAAGATATSLVVDVIGYWQQGV